MGESGEADGVLSVVGAPPTAEPEVDGLASAVHTSTAPIMAKPMAIQIRTDRLVRQRDELNNGFDPLVDSWRNRLSAQHPEAHRFAAAYLSVQIQESDSRPQNAHSTQRRGNPLCEKSAPQVASVMALGRAASIADIAKCATHSPHCPVKPDLELRRPTHWSH